MRKVMGKEARSGWRSRVRMAESPASGGKGFPSGVAKLKRGTWASR